MTKKKKAGWAEKNFLELSSEGCVRVSEVGRGASWRWGRRGSAWSREGGGWRMLGPWRCLGRVRTLGT